MYTLVYVSSAVDYFSEEKLIELLAQSRGKNLILDITGILLFKHGNFMQLLEGPKDAVLGLMTSIKADTRHRGVVILVEEEREKREFAQWSMGFKRLDSDTLLEVPGYSDFLNVPLTSEEFQTNPSKSVQLLLSFKKILS